MAEWQKEQAKQLLGELDEIKGPAGLPTWNIKAQIFLVFAAIQQRCNSRKEKIEDKNMKAISLKQPWASMIANGQKTIETRTWATDYRGDVLICASKRPKIDDLPTGQALCVATIVDCRPMVAADEKTACCELYPGAYAWVLKSIRQIEPFPVKGQLGFYEVNYQIAKAKPSQRRSSCKP